MTKLVLRDYQKTAVDAGINYLWSQPQGAGLLLAPTGTGKSLIIAGLVEEIKRRHFPARIVMLTHVKELVEQNYEKIRAMTDLSVGIWSAGLNKKDYHYDIVFAGIDTVARNALNLGQRDVLLIDEAHRVSPSPSTNYQQTLAALRSMNPNASALGLTATDYRLGQGLLTDEWYDRKSKEIVAPFWKHVVVDMTSMENFNWFIQEGYLKRLVPRPTNAEIDVSSMRMRGGEYLQADVEQIVNNEQKVSTIVDEICEMGIDRRSWLVFGAGNRNADLITAELQRRGISCAVLSEATPKLERKRILEDYKAYKIRCLVNNDILTTGFDHSGVDLIAVVRVTMSTALWVQMLGRGTRPVYASGFDLNTTAGRLSAIVASGVYNCLVLDFAGNSKRLGAINAPVKPTPRGKPSRGGGDAPVKLCMSCGTLSPTIVKVCEFCGAEFPLSKQLTDTASTRELITETQHVPDVRRMQVTSVRYSAQEIGFGIAKKTVVRAAYSCGKSGTFHERLTFAGGKSSKRTKTWWGAFGDGTPVPASNSDFLQYYAHSRVKKPRVVEVYLNNPKKEKPEITYYGFDDASSFEEHLDTSDDDGE